MLRAAAILTSALVVASPAAANWSMNYRTSAVDGKRSITLSTLGQGGTIIVVCTQEGRVVSVSYGTRIAIFRYGSVPGTFRFEGAGAPVNANWRAEADDAYLINERATAAFVRGLGQSDRVHLRINGAERTIGFQRLDISSELATQCGLSRGQR